ncbi:MAG: TetR/AcrR family transcriptional regulator [Candidatus Bathyarchaeia archaeon]|jgi:AcrR family transcriptional regulator
MPKVVPEYKEEARCKIVKAARVVFAQKGYHEATMDDIAKEVGVSKGALYSYFESKEDILKEISLQSHQTLRDTLRETGKFTNLEAVLEQVYTAITEKYKGNLHTHFEIIALSSHDPKIRQIVREEYQKDIEAVEAFVEEKKKQGAIRTDVDARVLSELFTALYMGTLAKLVIGFPSKEVHDHWIKSMILILGKTKTTDPESGLGLSKLQVKP